MSHRFPHQLGYLALPAPLGIAHHDSNGTQHWGSSYGWICWSVDIKPRNWNLPLVGYLSWKLLLGSCTRDLVLLEWLWKARMRSCRVSPTTTWSCHPCKIGRRSHEWVCCWSGCLQGKEPEQGSKMFKVCLLTMVYSGSVNLFTSTWSTQSNTLRVWRFQNGKKGSVLPDQFDDKKWNSANAKMWSDSTGLTWAWSSAESWSNFCLTSACCRSNLVSGLLEDDQMSDRPSSFPSMHRMGWSRKMISPAGINLFASTPAPFPGAMVGTYLQRLCSANRSAGSKPCPMATGVWHIFSWHEVLCVFQSERWHAALQ